MKSTHTLGKVQKPTALEISQRTERISRKREILNYRLPALKEKTDSITLFEKRGQKLLGDTGVSRESPDVPLTATVVGQRSAAASSERPPQGGWGRA